MSGLLCYPCLFEQASTTGQACVGNYAKHGKCPSCGAADRHLYHAMTLSDVATRTPMPVLRRHERYSPAPIWFGWSLVLLAVGLALAAFLLSRSAHPAERQSFEQWVESAARRLPVYHEDRAPELAQAKQEQLSRVASAVARLSRKAPLPPRQWAALLLIIGWHESTYSLRIHAGDCRPKECDRGKARGPWQTHQNAFNREDWPRLVGIENTDVQAGAADQLLRRVVRTCPDEPGWATVRGILTAYAGRQCYQDWPGLGARLSTFGGMRP